jgi:hypothetical protein
MTVSLHKKRLSCQMRLQAERLTPISRLPIELLLDSIRILPATSRVACSHVCRAWRNIVVQDPQCWRDLTLRGTSAASRRKVAAWKMRLDGQSLRALRLDTEPTIAEVMPLAESMDRLQELTVDFAGMVRPEPLFKLLLHLRSESTETLTCLQLQLPPASCFYPDLFLFLSHFTRLRSCWLTIPGSGQHGRIDLPRLDLEAQKLASLTFPAMCDFRVDFCDTRAPVPLELHFPQLERLTWHGALPFLQSNAIMPRLKSLDVHWLHDEQRPAAFSMGGLVNLRLGRQFGPSPLQQLCCPQLQTLRLTGGRQAQLATTLPDFATRSPLVTSLRIDYLSSLSDAQFIAILALWPRLSQLDLQHTNLEGAFVEDLPSLKQPLTHFGLSQCGTIKASPIIKLVKSRLDAGAKLESLTLMDCPAMEPEGLKWLRETVPQVKHRYQDPKEEARMARRILAR